MQQHQSALINLHLAVFLFGGTALFSKLIALPALDITVYRTAIAFFTLIVILKVQSKQLRLNQLKDYFIAVGLGVIVGIHWVTYFSAMQMAGIATGIIAFFTYPVITVLLEPLFSKTHIKFTDLFNAVVVIFGIYLMMPNANLGDQVTLGILTGVLSGAFFATRNLLQKKYFSQYGGSHTMLYQTLTAAVILSIFVDNPPSTLPLQDIYYLLLAGMVFTAIPHSFFASSLRHLSATTVGLISCLQPLYGTVLAYMLLSETTNMTTLIGGVLVVSAACFETWSITRKK
ncbi:MULTISPECIES: DMT family transporter [Pseudoalteromonas]|uniref:DMT family transporter n=1 Tax=Pseudoalteromonas obscura TaxID=3048491 RepID=A0ABT7EUI9_9GAMM|nr:MULTISPECIES: DMT family transporter [Pseudoalteromonas]MBQ4840104.1 DMT family transporter [Pseudoalteromonas luteoviolacea]MDK2598711.1 DMT family transporter [Pseudoalteromonas sp. P94(2023)]